jgi:hypothetical protein
MEKQKYKDFVESFRSIIYDNLNEDWDLKEVKKLCNKIINEEAKRFLDEIETD